MIEDLYELIRTRPRFDWQCARRDLFPSGIYFFFEGGEDFEIGGVSARRIVRIGTHRGDGNFPGRIRQHFGHVHSLRGNKNSSVFRRHVGGALIRRRDPHDPRLTEWARQGGMSDPLIEEEVSGWMRQNLTFACISVERKDDRLRFERGLIALLAQSGSRPSTNWLGQHALAETIRRTGLWNTQETNATPLSREQLGALKEFARV